MVLPDLPPPRPPRPRSISASGSSASKDEFSTPVIPSVRLPSVIVTPCTPSTKASRTYIRTSDFDELNLDENGESSGSDANSCVASVDSNPFLSDPSPPLQKEFTLPPLGPGALNYRHRARSLTGTGRGLHQRLSRSEYIIGQPITSLPRVAKTGMLTNTVIKSDSPLLIGNSVAPSASASKSSSIRSRPNVVWDSTSQAIADQRIRSYMTSPSSETSTDQTLVLNVTLDTTRASTRHSEDPKAGAAASCEAQPAVLTYTNTMAMDQITMPSNLAPSIHGHALLGLIPYTEVFDLDAYFDSDSSLPSESTLKSSLNASCSTIDSNKSMNPFLVPTKPSANCSTSTIFVPPSQPLRRISNISDTTASSTSIYTCSLSNTSTDTDESAPTPRRFGITDNGRKSKITFDHEVKRYRDHYRPPAYSRSPAFVIESPTTSRKFTRKRESDGLSVGDRANKENESISALTTSKVSPTPTSTRANLLNAKIANPNLPQNSSCPCHFHNARMPRTRRAPALLVRDQQKFKPFRDQMARVSCTPDSSMTTTFISPTGMNIATRHRLGSVAISQRRNI